jgi:cellobiose phosphorylase
MKKEYGYFNNGGHQYVITDPATPRHWYNYLWNDRYITFISQVGYGEGFAQDDMGRRAQLLINRQLYLIDSEENEFWTANALPINRGYSDYQCTHGIGYTEIKLDYKAIETKFRVFVPREEQCEIWTLKIKNKREAGCQLKAIAYVKTALDGFFRPQGYEMGSADYDQKKHALIGMNYGAFGGSDEVPIYGFLTSRSDISGYDARNDAFIGPYSDECRPEAVEKGGCQNSDCYAEKMCFALENTIELEAGEDIELHFIAGVTVDTDEIPELRNRFFTGDAVQKEFDATLSKLASDIDGITIDTPDEGLNNLFNGFLKHQASLGSRWARVRHNGFRDTNCDCECLGIVNPSLAWERAKRILSYQYSNGFAPRTFLDGRVQDRGYADNTVWITFNIYHLLKEIGDLSVLDQPVPFNDGTCASVYTHVKRSVDYLWSDRGELGLVRLHGGDWNDCINLAGLKGKGMSVWLSIAWFLANRQFAEIARLKGCPQDAERADTRADEMRAIIDRHGWDGDYYIADYTDDGKKIGSHECDEGKIHLIHQAWAVMAGVDTDGKGAMAMDAVEKYLVTDLGAVMIWPPYTYYRNDIGITTQKLPGVHENSSAYLHACTWKLAADCILKRNETVQEDIEKILPDNDKWVEKKAEPYILCNSYYSKDASYRYARPGQSWRTGSGAWFLKDIGFYVFGLQPEMEGLRLNPCLPPDWKSCAVTKKFRGANYQISYEQINPGPCNTIREMIVNGKPFQGDVLPWEENGDYVVEVTLE